MTNDIITIEAENETDQPLQGTSREGDFVHATQEMATELGFKNVSKKWVEKCTNWDSLFNSLEQSSQLNRDVTVPIEMLQLSYDPETQQLQLAVDGEGEYLLSDHSGRQITLPNQTGLGTHLLGMGRNLEERQIVGNLVSSRWATITKENKGKKFFLRLRENGTKSVRAILSEKYGVIDHMWLADVVRQKIGNDALISHFDNDAFRASGGDYVRYNVLIPDHMRVEEDSEYGGMFSLGNSEVGSGRLLCFPSLFRAICMNGCIWGQATDSKYEIKKVHRGNVDYEYLKYKIHSNIDKAIPLLATGLDQMIKLKERETLENSVSGDLELLGWIGSKALGLDKTDRKSLYKSYMTQSEQEGDIKLGAFAVVNAMTRFAQTGRFSQQKRVDLEMTAGEYMVEWQDEAKWKRTLGKSSGFDYAKDLVTVGA